jgi:hypothetical protein
LLAFHGPNYGLSAEADAKLKSKLDPTLLKEATEVGAQLRSLLTLAFISYQYVAKRSGVAISGDLGDALNDGSILCKMAQNIDSTTCKKINGGKMPFMKMENISSYLVSWQRARSTLQSLTRELRVPAKSGASRAPTCFKPSICTRRRTWWLWSPIS